MTTFLWRVCIVFAWTIRNSGSRRHKFFVQYELQCNGYDFCLYHITQRSNFCLLVWNAWPIDNCWSLSFIRSNSYHIYILCMGHIMFIPIQKLVARLSTKPMWLYLCFRGLFLEYIGWSKPCSWFDGASHLALRKKPLAPMEGRSRSQSEFYNVIWMGHTKTTVSR